MTRKYILHWTGMISTKYGALEHYFVELSRACLERGYYTAFQFEEIPKSAKFISDLRNQKAIINKIVLKEFGLFKSARKIIKIMFAVRPEIVHTHFIFRFNFLFIAIIARMLGVRKIISTVHSNPGFRDKSLSRFAYNFYDRVLAVSNGVARNLLSAGVKRRIVFNHYLGLMGHRERSQKFRTRFRNEFGIADEATVIACIAFDSPFKGLDILLSAFAKVAKSHQRIHLIIIGVEPLKSALAEQAVSLGLEGKVHWAGIRDKGWHILNAADLYVQSSRFGEGLSLSIMEAMALKLPIIATKVAGQAEAVIDGETGYLAEPDSIDSLSDTLMKMLNNQSRWGTMAEAAYLRYMKLFKGENSIKILLEDHYRI